MTYTVPNSEIAISYNGVSYVVTLTTAADQFRVKSPVDGSFETVDAATAAHLFGAEQAYRLLTRLYDTAHVEETSTDWNNILQIDSQIVGWSAANNALGNVSGLVLSSFLTGGLGTAFSATNSADALFDFTKNLAPNAAELAYVGAAIADASQHRSTPLYRHYETATTCRGD